MPKTDAMKFTYCGHATFLVETRGHRLLFDPFLSPNEMVTEARAKMEDDEKRAMLDPDRVEADFILVTHGHMDHTADLKAIAKRTGATVISNYEIVSWLGDGYNGRPLNHGGKAEFPFGTVKYVNAVHSSVLPDGTYGGNPGGFVVWNEEGCFYLAGDTALTLDMKLIPLLCPKLDLAILPIGDNFTMGYEDAVIASEYVDCRRIIGCHYDTFGLIEIDQEAARKAFSDEGKELLLPAIGESILL